MFNRLGGQRAILLTTLIDLLVQVVFLFMIAYYGVSTTLAALQDDVKKVEESTGQTLPLIPENWRRLVAAESGGKYNDSEMQLLRKRLAVLEAENQRLRGKGGLDQPPCWRTVTNQPEFILSIFLLEDGLVVSKAWPEERSSEVAALGITEEQVDKRYNASQFKQTFGRLRPKPSGPTCQHFVLVYDKSTTKEAYTKHLFAIEEIFYKKLIRN